MTDTVMKDTDAFYVVDESSAYPGNMKQVLLDQLTQEKKELDDFLAGHIEIGVTVRLALQEASFQRSMWMRDLRKQMEEDGKHDRQDDGATEQAGD